MLSAKEQAILRALEPQAQQEGIEVVTVEVVGAKKSPTIRVYIDTPEGVSFDELSQAQSWIDGIVEQLDPFPGAYMLEVSSPGIDRPLRTPEHFNRFAGETVNIKTRGPIEGRSSFTGTLEGFADGAVRLSVDEQPVAIPYDVIKKARVKGTVDFSS